jgi:rod shape-determining protein MreB
LAAEQKEIVRSHKNLDRLRHLCYIIAAAAGLPEPVEPPTRVRTHERVSPMSSDTPTRTKARAERTMFLSKLMGFVSSDVAIDLGTANTLVYVKGKGIVLNEPSVVAIDKGNGGVVTVGREAKAMLGRTPDQIMAIRPLQDGVIADFEITEQLLRAFIARVQQRRVLIRPRIIICVPSGITEVEKRAVHDSAVHAGARDVFLVAEPIAAAIGVGLPVAKASGNMVIDVGGGTTEIAVISLNGIVSETSTRMGGDKMDEAISQYVKRKHNLLIGDQTAEHIKIKIGSAFPLEQEMEIEIRGRDLIKGIPKTIKVTSLEIRDAIQEPIEAIVEALKQSLEKTPPELASDIVDRGITMTGGGALLRGIDALLREATNLPITVADDPLTCVVLGTGKILDNLDAFDKVIMRV